MHPPIACNFPNAQRHSAVLALAPNPSHDRRRSAAHSSQGAITLGLRGIALPDALLALMPRNSEEAVALLRKFSGCLNVSFPTATASISVRMRRKICVAFWRLLNYLIC